MGSRRVSGLLQMALAVAGLLLSGRWAAQLMTFYTKMIADESLDFQALPLTLGLLAVGFGIVLAAWLWSLASSLQFLRAARKTKL